MEVKSHICFDNRAGCAHAGNMLYQQLINNGQGTTFVGCYCLNTIPKLEYPALYTEGARDSDRVRMHSIHITGFVKQDEAENASAYSADTSATFCWRILLVRLKCMWPPPKKSNPDQVSLDNQPDKDAVLQHRDILEVLNLAGFSHLDDTRNDGLFEVIGSANGVMHTRTCETDPKKRQKFEINRKLDLTCDFRSDTTELQERIQPPSTNQLYLIYTDDRSHNNDDYDETQAHVNYQAHLYFSDIKRQ